MRQLAGGLAAAALSLGVAGWLAAPRLAGPPLPDFSQWPAGGERKQQFFSYLRPLLEAENARIAAQRQRLTAIEAAGRVPTDRDRRWLADLAEAYAVETDGRTPGQLVDELLLRVDTVPVSLGLAQAAKESGWGTSRFAVEGNALFGQRCFETGCGVVPEDRGSGASFEVRAFATPAAAVRSYLRNLNTHPDYQALRRLRAELRAAGRRVTGFALARTLTSYSERGSDYAEEIRQMIHFNGLGPVERGG